MKSFHTTAVSQGPEAALTEVLVCLITVVAVFVKIDDGERCDETKNVLNACNNHVQNISRLLKDVSSVLAWILHQKFLSQL